MQVTGAQALGGLFVATTGRSDDHDWYALPGGDIEEFEIVDISVLMAGPGCAASRPLFVVFCNPEGHWIRTYAVSRERQDVLVSCLPGRCYLEIRAADSSCSALVYGLSIISHSPFRGWFPATQRVEFVARRLSAQTCEPPTPYVPPEPAKIRTALIGSPVYVALAD